MKHFNMAESTGIEMTGWGETPREFAEKVAKLCFDTDPDGNRTIDWEFNPDIRSIWDSAYKYEPDLPTLRYLPEGELITLLLPYVEWSNVPIGVK